MYELNERMAGRKDENMSKKEVNGQFGEEIDARMGSGVRAKKLTGDLI